MSKISLRTNSSDLAGSHPRAAARSPSNCMSYVIWWQEELWMFERETNQEYLINTYEYLSMYALNINFNLIFLPFPSELFKVKI